MVFTTPDLGIGALTESGLRIASSIALAAAASPRAARRCSPANTVRRSPSFNWLTFNRRRLRKSTYAPKSSFANPSQCAYRSATPLRDKARAKGECAPLRAERSTSLGSDDSSTRRHEREASSASCSSSIVRAGTLTRSEEGTRTENKSWHSSPRTHSRPGVVSEGGGGPHLADAIPQGVLTGGPAVHVGKKTGSDELEARDREGTEMRAPTWVPTAEAVVS